MAIQQFDSHLLLQSRDEAALAVETGSTSAMMHSLDRVGWRGSNVQSPESTAITSLVDMAGSSCTITCFMPLYSC